MEYFLVNNPLLKAKKKVCFKSNPMFRYNKNKQVVENEIFKFTRKAH